MLNRFSAIAGRRLTIDEDVYQSESTDGRPQSRLGLHVFDCLNVGSSFLGAVL